MRPLLIVLLAGEAAALFALTRVDPAAGSIPLLLLFILACAAALAACAANHKRPIRLRHLLLAAVLLRAPLLLTQPTLSDDVWRYLHDGRAQRAGVSPYAHAPASEATVPFRGPEHALINHPRLVTIYPPGAQLAFFAATLLGSTLFAWKLFLLGTELLLIVLLGRLLRARAQPAGRAALYAWHPLAVVEVAGNAHVEPIAIAALLAALLYSRAGRAAPAGAMLALSVAVKYWAAPLLPFLARRQERAGMFVAAVALTLLALYLPYLRGGDPLGSAGIFAASWASNAGAFALLEALLGSRRLASGAALLLLALALLLQWRRRATAEDAAWTLVFATLLLAPVVHPWYLLWLLALLPLRPPGDAPARAALWWACSVPAAYAVLPVYAATGVWAVPLPALLVQYLPVAALLAVPPLGEYARRLPRAPVMPRSPAQRAGGE